MKLESSLWMMLLPVLVATPAAATARFDCTIADANLALEASGLVSDGLGGVITGFEGTLSLSTKLLGEPLPALPLTRENLPHHWLFDDDFRLHVHVPAPEETSLGDLDLLLTTKADQQDETRFAGEYLLRLLATGHDGLEVKSKYRGPVSCVMG